MKKNGFMFVTVSELSEALIEALWMHTGMRMRKGEERHGYVMRVLATGKWSKEELTELMKGVAEEVFSHGK